MRIAGKEQIAYRKITEAKITAQEGKRLRCLRRVVPTAIMMTFDNLRELLYDDVNGHVVSVRSEDATTHIIIECDDERDFTRKRRFEIVFADVKEITVKPSSSVQFFSTDDHPLLWQYNEEHVQMYFAFAPAAPFELIGQLYEAHRHLLKGWRELADYLYITSESLRRGHGLFAHGPKRVIQEYARVVGDSLRYSIVRGYTPNGGYSVVLFGKDYVVYRSVSVAEHEPIRTGTNGEGSQAGVAGL